MSLLNFAARGDVASLSAALRAGAVPNPPPGELAPIYLAHNPEVITALLEYGADPDWESDQGETALTRACHDGALGKVLALLAGGADADRPHSGWPPLFYAAMAGHGDIVEALLVGGASPGRVHDGRTALAIAVDHRHGATIDLLLALVPETARHGGVDPAGLARERGDTLLAERIDAFRWSAADAGLRGRLRVDPPARVGEPCEVFLLLENVGDAVRAVPSHSPLAFAWELTCDGEPVVASLARMEVMHADDWTSIAPGDTAALKVSGGHSPRTAIIDLVTLAWTEEGRRRTPKGRLHLAATYHANRKPEVGAPREAAPIRLALPATWVPRPRE
jgi:hypothetical protein